MSQLPAVIEDKVTALINTLRDSSLDNATYETAIALLQETAQEIMDFAADLKQELDRANDEIQGAYDILEDRPATAETTLHKRIQALKELELATETGDTDHPVVQQLWEQFEEFEAENMVMFGYYDELDENEQMQKALENTAASILNFAAMPPLPENVARAKRIAWALLSSQWNADGMHLSLNADLRKLVSQMWHALPSFEPESEQE